MTDGKLELFLSCIKKSAEPIMYAQIVSKCKRYEDLISFLREFNVAEDIIRIKRIMDRDPLLVYKTDILKAAKALQEEASVSETRVLFNETIKNPVTTPVHAESVLADLEGE